MKHSFEIKENFTVKPSVIYQSWLDSTGHSNMTGGLAHCSKQVGGEFTAWDGYISGKNKSLIQDKEIVQLWRTTEFEKHDEDSELKIMLRETEEGCALTLKHSNIPDGESDYKQGWVDHYFSPMKDYFKNK